MPGISGFTINNTQNGLGDLKSSLKRMTYYDWYVQDLFFEDENLVCSRVHLGVLGDNQSPIQENGVYAWVDGEFYVEKGENQSHGEYLIQAYRNETLISTLSKLDGYFSAVLYDSVKKRILLISDRLGFKNLFYSLKNNVFSWNSELKGFLGFSHFEKKIEKRAIDCFLNLGFLIGDLTWFESVKMMDASTILTYDLISQKIIEKKRYWSWGKVKRQQISFEDSVVKLSELIIKSVRKTEENTQSQSKLGITLSGGLDSRAILMACENKSQFGISTFGKNGCDDIRFAKMVTKKLGLDHSVLELNQHNWLEKRLDSVWKADAMSALNHLHFGVHHQEIKSFFDINLNGILGEIALGGALLKRKNQRISRKIVEKQFGKFAELVPFNDSFYDLDCEDVFWIDTRTRRFIHAGSVEFSKTVEQRNPFADNDLLEFIFSLPDDYRAHSKLYIQALMRIDVEMMEGIPWQKTGISPHRLTETILFDKFKIPQIINRLGLKKSKHFTDYPRWFRTEAAAKLFSEILNSKTAAYREFLNEDFEEKYLQPHLKGKGNFVEQISRVVSLEWWLKTIWS